MEENLTYVPRKVTKIIFVRHADHKNNKITRLGKKQAKLVCEDLKYENIGKVFCSPCLRARATADIITKALKIAAAEPRNELREREQLAFSPKTREEIEYMEHYLDPEYSFTSPEGCKEFLERSYKFLDEVCKSDFESVLIVGHSSFAYALTSYFAGLNKNKEVAWVRIGNCSKLCFESIKE